MMILITQFQHLQAKKFLKSIIADPEGTEINRFWFGYDIEDTLQ